MDKARPITVEIALSVPVAEILPDSQISAVASKSRHTRPMRSSGRYWAPPGHVCPPPLMM